MRLLLCVHSCVHNLLCIHNLLCVRSRPWCLSATFLPSRFSASCARAAAYPQLARASLHRSLRQPSDLQTASMSQNITVTFIGTTSGGGPSQSRNCSSLVVDTLGDGSLWSTSLFLAPSPLPASRRSARLIAPATDPLPQWSTVQREPCVSLNNSRTVQGSLGCG